LTEEYKQCIVLIRRNISVNKAWLINTRWGTVYF